MRQIGGKPNTFSTCKALVSQLHPFYQEGTTSKGGSSISSLGLREYRYSGGLVL